MLTTVAGLCCIAAAASSFFRPASRSTSIYLALSQVALTAAAVAMILVEKFN